jgi:hypothetical protein
MAGRFTVNTNNNGVVEVPDEDPVDQDDLMDQAEVPVGGPTAKDLDSDTEDDLVMEDTVAMSGGTENVGEISVEINVDELIAEFESESGVEPSPREGSARKRLEEVLEERRVAHELDELDELEATITE